MRHTTPKMTTDTAGTEEEADDWNAPSPASPDAQFLSAAATTQAASSSRPSAKLPWPVDVHDGSSTGARLRSLLASLSYSYMNPILQQGRNQFQSNDHLTLHNIYAVPPSMRSEVLVADFWYVCVEGRESAQTQHCRACCFMERPSMASGGCVWTLVHSPRTASLSRVVFFLANSKLTQRTNKQTNTPTTGNTTPHVNRSRVPCGV
jgi:hypothetical protein